MAANKIRDFADKYFIDPFLNASNNGDVIAPGTTSTNLQNNPDKPPAVGSTTKSDLFDERREKYGDVRGEGFTQLGYGDPEKHMSIIREEQGKGLDEVATVEPKEREGGIVGTAKEVASDFFGENARRSAEITQGRGRQSAKEGGHTMQENARMAEANRRLSQGEDFVRE